MNTLLIASSILGWTFYLTNRWRVSALRRRLKQINRAYAGSTEANRLLAVRLKSLIDQVTALKASHFEENKPAPLLVLPKN